MNSEPHPLDIVAPAKIAQLVNDVGVHKVNMNFGQTLGLGILAGAFIAFGAMFYTVTITGSTLGLGPTKLLGGVSFSLGLILVIIGGAELFTGNSLIVMAWANKLISTKSLLRNWSLVYVGNLIGAISTALLVYLSGVLNLSDGAVGSTAEAIATSKISADLTELFIRAILCNVLVCLAVWMCFACHTVPGRILVIIFPISAFVTMGFEHSIANMYLIPIGLLNAGQPEFYPLILNLIVTTAGNIIGGGVLVALVYWIIYARAARSIT